MGFVHICRQGKEFARHALGNQPILVGGSAECDVQLPGTDAGVGQIALLEQGGVAGLRRAGPASEIRINDRPIGAAENLQNGDALQIGDFTVTYSEAAAAAPGEDAGQVGEWQEPDPEDTVEIRIGLADGMSTLPVGPDLMQALRSRLALWQELDRLEASRKSILADEATPSDVADEYRRQTQETAMPLMAEAARQRIDRLQERYRKAMALAKAEDRPPPSEALQSAWKMAIRQWTLFAQYEDRASAVAAASLPLAKEEPLYKGLCRAGVDCRELFTWALYGLALEAVESSQNRKRQTLRKELEELKSTIKKQSGLFRTPDADLVEKLASLEAEELEGRTVVSWVSREKKAIEKQLVSLFWSVYEDAACLLTAGKFQKSDEVHVRAFLRYGLLGVQPWWIDPERSRYILHECADALRLWDDSMKATHVLYADEYLCFVARGKITPAVDENLELNQRNTPDWKADRCWRRLIYSRVRESSLRELRSRIEQTAKKLRKRQARAEEAREKAVQGGGLSKEEKQRLNETAQTARVEAARLERAIGRIDETYLAGNEEQREECKTRLAELGIRYTLEWLTRREVKSVRRVSRLSANLQEPFLPFVIRENFKIGTDCVNSRKEMLEAVAGIEASDSDVFVEPLMPVKRKAQRLDLRYSPVILLTPACGFLGYAWNPRAGAEIGRLVFPSYLPRSNMRERLLCNLFADFRWDTSKAEAGVDLLTSDTLVAAYATVRWDFRKRSKEAREKAGIYSEMPDRKNWRRHYSLFMESAGEGGKKLFYRCLEVYEQVVLKYIGLPDGVERLRR